MKFRKIVITTLMLFIPTVAFFFTMSAMTHADSADEPYSIFFLAGQSWAEGTNSKRNNLPDTASDPFYQKYNSPADTDTGLWWAGADGAAPTNFIDTIQWANGVTFAGWLQSGGGGADGAARLKNLNDTQRAGFFGPELGMGRELYNMGRRKVIILKVSYGFQSLAQSNSPMVPYDFNVHSDNKSYTRMVTEYKALTDYLRSIGKTFTLDGMLWTQGGTDALQNSYANAYKQNFIDLVTRMEQDFQFQPSAHIVAGKMSLQQCLLHSSPSNDPKYCGFTFMGSLDPLLVANDWTVAGPNFADRIKTVRDAIQYVADNDQSYTNKVDALEMNDVPSAFDSIHYSEVGNLLIGKRFAHMYKLPYRIDGANVVVNNQTRTSTDYDGDGIPNSQEDTGRGPSCPLIGSDGKVIQTAHDGNLGDDDTDCDGYPNYLDSVNGPGSGLAL